MISALYLAGPAVPLPLCPDLNIPGLACPYLLNLGRANVAKYPNYCAPKGYDLSTSFKTLPSHKYFIGQLCPTSCKANTRDVCGVCSSATKIADGSSCPDLSVQPAVIAQTSPPTALPTKAPEICFDTVGNITDLGGFTCAQMKPYCNGSKLGSERALAVWAPAFFCFIFLGHGIFIVERTRIPVSCN